MSQENDPFEPKTQAPAPAEEDGLSEYIEEPAVVVDAQGESPEGKKKKRKWPIVVGVLLAIIVVLGAAAGGFCYWVYTEVQKEIGYVPEKTTLDGETDISGLSEAEVESVVTRNLSNGKTPGVTLDVEGITYNIKYANVGTVDAEATAEAAIALDDRDMEQRCKDFVMELVGQGTEPEAHDISTVYSVDEKKIKKRLKSYAKDIDQDAVNASYTYDSSTNTLVGTQSKEGKKFKVKKTLKDIMAAVNSGTYQAKVTATIVTVEPEKAELGQAIYVDTNACQLYFYVNGKVEKQYPCTPGKAGYETPTGDWYLMAKDPSPTWYNPGSDWAKSMPDTIAPGENNPLGLRSLALSCGGGIYIHGTTTLSQLGTRASHGCIRLANASVVELYDLVETGIPIFVR